MHHTLAADQPADLLLSDADLDALVWAEAMFHAHAQREQLLAAGVERDERAA